MNRVNSGQSIQPFKPAKLTDYRTTRYAVDYASPEEFLFASTNQGGSGLLGTKEGEAINFKYQSIVAGVIKTGQNRE